MLRELTGSTFWNLLQKPKAGATICSHFTVTETEAEVIQERGQRDPTIPLVIL